MYHNSLPLDSIVFHLIHFFLLKIISKMFFLAPFPDFLLWMVGCQFNQWLCYLWKQEVVIIDLKYSENTHLWYGPSGYVHSVFVKQKFVEFATWFNSHVIILDIIFSYALLLWVCRFSFKCLNYLPIPHRQDYIGFLRASDDCLS